MRIESISGIFIKIVTVAIATICIADLGSCGEFDELRCFEIKVMASNEKDRPAVNTINGSGMIGGLCDNRWANTWSAIPDVNDQSVWIKYDFERVHNLRQIKVWNYNEETKRGLNNVTIDYSIDGNKWIRFGDFELAKASGKINSVYTSSIDLKGISARTVKISAECEPGIGNHGDSTLYGLSEVRFYINPEADDNRMTAGRIAPPPRLRLRLDRGITIDRQMRSMPPEPWMMIEREDIKLIKYMGFEFVKFLINPELFKRGDGIDLQSMKYIDTIMNYAVGERLPVVICIHPENDFKFKYLSDKSAFGSLLGFYKEFASYLAERWNADKIAFQLMTEPFGASSNADDWNYWNKLQRKIWHMVRKEMPEHTLILSGDTVGQIEGFCGLAPVNDENVMYSFTFYEPHIFTFHNGSWQPGGMPYLKNLPYPAKLISLDSISNLLDLIPEQYKLSMKADIERYAGEKWNIDRLRSRMKLILDWNRYYGNGKLKIWCAEFGCFQNGANPVDRLQYIRDMRNIFDELNIGWSYWSYNETFSVMTADREPFGPANEQTPDADMLKVLLPQIYK